MKKLQIRVTKGGTLRFLVSNALPPSSPSLRISVPRVQATKENTYFDHMKGPKSHLHPSKLLFGFFMFFQTFLGDPQRGADATGAVNWNRHAVQSCVRVLRRVCHSTSSYIIVSTSNVCGKTFQTFSNVFLFRLANISATLCSHTFFVFSATPFK